MSDDGLAVWESECDFVVATSAEDAELVWREMCGPPDADTPNEWSRVPDERALSIKLDEPGRQAVKKAAKDWALSEGRSFLASSEW